jgi:hypothetical protein
VETWVLALLRLAREAAMLPLAPRLTRFLLGVLLLVFIIIDTTLFTGSTLLNAWNGIKGLGGCLFGQTNVGGRGSGGTSASPGSSRRTLPAFDNGLFHSVRTVGAMQLLIET